MSVCQVTSGGCHILTVLVLIPDLSENNCAQFFNKEKRAFIKERQAFQSHTVKNKVL